jgi:serine/threonine-protein kinase
MSGESDDSLSASDAWLREVARAPAVALPDLVGERLGRYRVSKVLGAGGMGIVYLAEDEQLGREVALKVLPIERIGDEVRRRRFVREARLAAGLRHPAIATIYDAGEIGARAFLAMEYVSGITLRETLRLSGPLSIGEVLRVGRAIADGLAAAHEARIVHRDIKPDNVIVASDGAVKVLDFGAAKLRDRREEPAAPANEATLETQEGLIIGTPAYMSPEQAKGAPVDVRSDVFSLGVTLYEMTTGQRPFEGKTALDLLVAIDRDEPLRVSRRRRGVPTGLDRIILRCLAKDPAERPADAGEVSRALAGIRVEERSWKRLGGGIGLGGLAVVVAAGALAGRTNEPAPPHASTSVPSAAPVAVGDSASAAASPAASPVIGPVPAPPSASSLANRPARPTPTTRRAAGALTSAPAPRPATSRPPGPLDDPK